MEYLILISGLLVGFLYGRAYAKFSHAPGEYHNGNTMSKVDIALRASGLSADQSKLAIGFMQNRGILFRESVKPKSVVDPESGKGPIG